MRKRVFTSLVALAGGYYVYRAYVRSQRKWYQKIHFQGFEGIDLFFSEISQISVVKIKKNKINSPKTKAPDLREIKIINSIEEAERYAAEILDSKVDFVGLDCEWVGKNKTGSDNLFLS